MGGGLYNEKQEDVKTNQSKYVRRSVLQDAHDLGPNLRAADMQELQASAYSNGTEALLTGLQYDECYTVLSPATGTPMAMFGAIPARQAHL